jgi:hypothetical protein
MGQILGYGEDALTLRLLKNRPKEILERFNDRTEPPDCLVFYRPSFGRSGGSGSAEFGEFDAILASKENVYLIESKWDNHRPSNRTELVLRPEQIERHRVFRWYLGNWSDRYSNDWRAFTIEKGAKFVLGKKIAPTGSLLATNLQQILAGCMNIAQAAHTRTILKMSYCSSIEVIRIHPKRPHTSLVFYRFNTKKIAIMLLCNLQRSGQNGV